MANPAPGYAKKPEHRVDLLPETRRVRVVFNGTVIADSTASLRCEETGTSRSITSRRKTSARSAAADRPQELLPVQGRLLVLDGSGRGSRRLEGGGQRGVGIPRAL